MRSRKKLIIYYVSEFFLSILLFILLLAIILKSTVFNLNFFYKQLDKNNYYEQLAESINKGMTNYVYQSGLDETIFEGLYTEKSLKEEVQRVVRNFYVGRKISVNTDDIEKKLNENINKYIEENNLIVDKQEDLDAFVEQELKVYKEKIVLTDVIAKFSGKFGKMNNVITISIFGILSLFIILLVLAKKACRRLLLPVPCLTTAFLTLLGHYLIFSQLSIKNLSFWNSYVSDVIISIINNISLAAKISSIILIVIAFTLTIIQKLLIKPKIKVKQ